MTLSFHSIVKQIKKEIESLSDESSKEEIVAKMYAIKSLTDVIIHSEKSSPSENVQDEINEQEAKMMGIHKSAVSNKKSVLEEDDANGESIFDF